MRRARTICSRLLLAALMFVATPTSAASTLPFRYGAFHQALRGYLGCVIGVYDQQFTVCLVAYAFSDHVRLVMDVARLRFNGQIPDPESYVEDVRLPADAITIIRRKGFSPYFILDGTAPRTGSIHLEAVAPLGWISSGREGQWCIESHRVHYELNGPEIAKYTDEAGWFGGVQVRENESSTCNAYFGMPTDGIWILRTFYEEGRLP